MGSSASKAIKPAAIKASFETTLPSARAVPREAPKSEAKVSTGTTTPKAEAGDLSYLQNLNALGPVWVPPKTTLLRSDSKMLDILKKRAASEAALDVPTPNRISAQSLSNLLDDRKAAKSKSDVAKLLKEYGVDMEVEMLEELARHINAPSVSSVQSTKEELEETQMARWVDPPMTAQKTLGQRS